MFARNSDNSTPNNSTSNKSSAHPSPASAIPSPTGITLLPSEASALLHSLLVENNIMSSSINTISQDFCLYEQLNDASFDYPLFAESSKLGQQSQQPQQHQQQQQQQRYLQQGQQGSIDAVQSTPAHGHVPVSIPAALCTPQTPSLELLTNNDSVRPNAADAETDPNATAVIAALLIRQDEITHSHGHQQQQQQHYYQPNQVSLVDTPFTPYLDTPFETPALSDFGLENGDFDINAFANGPSLFGVDYAEGIMSTRTTGLVFTDTVPLFFEMPSTVEPSTFFAGPIESGNVESGLVQVKVEDASHDVSLFLSDASSTLSSPALSDDLTFKDEDGDDDNGSPHFDPSALDYESDDDFDDQDKDASFSPAAASISRKHMAKSACTSSNKRTRPTLASPYGGNKRLDPSSPSLSNDKFSAVKRYTCDFPGCGRGFARLFNMRTHQRTHDPNHMRPFVCEVFTCAKRFSRKHDLQRHEASVHKGERKYRCGNCDRSFSRQDGLRRHYNLKGTPCSIDQDNGAEDAFETSDASDSENGWSAT
ncbi:hypothetical protein BGX33_010426 [Mortierella sp. NVP41]|nr:hypothetical protein BGX33_010426 [Mortierella sp. NVP41]